MKMRSLAAALVLCTGLATTFGQTTGHAQPEKPKQVQPSHTPPKAPEGKHDAATPAGMPSPEQMQAMLALSPEQIELARTLTGDWTTEFKCWMAPDAPVVQSTGKANFNPILGARFVRQTYSGEMEGMKFQGEGVMGFNKAAKKYQSSWMDSMSGSQTLSEGEKNEKGELVFNDDYTCPMDGTHKTGKTIVRMEGKNKMTLEMWTNTSDGKTFKSMEINYTKVEAPNRTNVTPGVEPKAPAAAATPATPAKPATATQPKAPSPK